MGIFKVKPQTRGPRGEGRTKIYKPLQLPEEVISDLKLYQCVYSEYLSEEKDEYGTPIPARLTMEQMLYRWMDNVKLFDKPVYNEFQAVKKYRKENPSAPRYPVNPVEGPIWDMGYLVDRDGEEYEMVPDEELYFSTVIDGEKMGVEQLINEEWTFMNDAGIEMTIEEAKAVSKKILKHQKRVAKK